MQLAEYSVPKINYAEERDNRGSDGGLFFCALRDGIRGFALKHPSAKLLVVSDSTALEAVASIPKSHRTVFLVLNEEDCLPLFSMPDGVSCVVVAGRKQTLFAARYFARIRKVPCLVFPSDGALYGASELQGELCCGGIRTNAILAESEVCCDVALIKNASGAFASLLLSRLALTEARALRAFRIECGNSAAEERAYALLSSLPVQPTVKELAQLHAELRQTEREGAYLGEGRILAELLREEGVEEPEWCAFNQLLALYSTFFSRGKPRKYHIPDYAVRSVIAGTEYPALNIPTEAEFASRALALETVRAQFTLELAAIIKRKTAYERTLRSLGGRVRLAGISALKKLPELAHGLCAVIRDFGLMDW